MNAARLHPALLLGAILCMTACARSGPEPLVLSGVTMGTTWEVKIADPPASVSPEALQRGILGILDEIDRSMSTYRPDSELSRLNADASGDWFALSDSLHAVLLAALDVSQQTNGAFDVTVGPVVNLWGFGPDRRPRRVPSDAEREAALARSGFRKLEIDPAAPRARKQIADLFIDLNGIAPGHAVDRIVEYLSGAGCGNFLVELGGEIGARGTGPGGRDWRVGIERPLPGPRGAERVVLLRNAGLSTSGDYREFFEEGGIRYGHTIDPASGKPVSHGLAAVTVVHASAMRADALATALMVLGPEAGRAFSEREGIAALFIIRDGAGFEELTSPQMRALLNE
ncbi:MAG TPA: FAD:protein FMN transferase [Gammaproteobacteria bacterium]